MSEQRQVTPIMKENVGACGCGLDKCNAYGTLRAKPHKDGTLCCRRGCPCPRCRGGGNRRAGARGQRKAMVGLGVPVGTLSPGHEEHALGTVRLEVKSGKQAGPVATAYLKAEAQSEEARPFGDHRPFVACFEPLGWSDGLVVIRRSRLAETVAALAEQLGMS